MKLLFVVSTFYKQYSKELLRNALNEIFVSENLEYFDHNPNENLFRNNSFAQSGISKDDIINLVFEEIETDGIFNFKLCDAQNAMMHDITIASIIGSMEIPQAISFFLAKHKYDGVIAIGVIKKGATKHDEYVTQQALNGISHLSLTYKLPITSAIIAAQTEDLIKERIEISGYNVGGNAVKTCRHLISLKQKIQTIK